MSKRQANDIKCEQINHTVAEEDCTWFTVFVSPGYDPESYLLTRGEFAEHNADPDLFVAKHFGFATVDEYRERNETRGFALCSERTRSGKLCRNSIRMTSRPEEWREHHRSAPCWSHAAKVRS
jgi:hypothetical protein